MVADVSGQAIINAHAPATLATAGAGDVLAGIIAEDLVEAIPAALTATLEEDEGEGG